MKKWTADIEQKNLETKEQWEARKSKIQEDIKKWQDQTREDWKEGVKQINKGFFKLYWRALLVIIPIIIIIIIVFAAVNNLFR